MSQLPSSTQVLVVGGGIVGCSVAYHLADRGFDVLLLERAELTAGTTWHAAGLVAQLRSTRNLTRLACYSGDLYERLEAETGQATGYFRCGSLGLATTEARWTELRRSAAMARSFGVEIEEIDAAEVAKLWPIADVSDVVGAVYLPRDGQTNPVDTTQALARGARQKGATLLEEQAVSRLLRTGDRVTGVELADGQQVEAETVVICAGLWSRELAKTAGVSVPLHAAEHFYLVTEALPQLASGGIERRAETGPTAKLPILRDPDHQAYYREETGDKLLVGFFEPVAKPWGHHGIPADFRFGTLRPDYEHLAPQLEAMSRRIPALAETGIQLLFNGPESFTPDDQYLLGPAPEVEGLYVAAGFNSIGIQSAGGVGWVLADWIESGHPPFDLLDVSLDRFQPFHGSEHYLHDRTTETLGLLYDMHWPHRQPATARGARRSPLHDRLAAAGACFGERAGWERANWYAEESQPAEYRYDYDRQNWHEASGEEHRATREAVALFDQTSFSKHLVQGPDAASFLERLSCNRVSGQNHRATYTPWLNERGGIEADLTVLQLEEERFLVIGYAGSQTRDAAWMRRQQRVGEFVTCTDVTSAFAVLNVMGPRSPELLASLCGPEFADREWSYGDSTELELAYARVRASRLSYVGEVGWELLIPTEHAVDVYDQIVAHGRRFGLKHAGYHAMESLRLERGYREWGTDLSAHDTPLDSGLAFTVDWDKDFLGRAALEEIRAHKKHPSRLVLVLLDDPEPILFHDEPIWRDGVRVGRITSAAYGHTLGRAVGMARLENPEGVTAGWLRQGSFEVEIAERRWPIQASLKPFLAPPTSRSKA